MKKQNPKSKKPKEDFSYPASEDIYSQEKKVTDITPEDDKGIDSRPTGNKEPRNEKGPGIDKSGNDLDVLGAELDDAQEEVGSEDEENNYYSLGGDKEDGYPQEGRDEPKP
ncbi:MAG: hypothetical protein U0V74_02470 [Chitinophagales bacterium]